MLLGPRQTGKTTLLETLTVDRWITLLDSRTRFRYEKDPHLLSDELAVLADELKRPPQVVIDEIQLVPSLMHTIQLLIDKKRAQFVLSGSSARKLKRESDMNLLPGRLVVMRLDALVLSEYLDMPPLNDALLYGALPEIALSDITYKQDDLESYVLTYLEEEIKKEAEVRQLGPFLKFFELAARRSGRVINVSKLSQAIGVGRHTVQSYFQILEDCLIIEQVHPITESDTRKKLTKTAKYLFFDMGIRRVASRLGNALSDEVMGHLFEEFIGIELIRQLRLVANRAQLKFWRDPDGPEVDFVIDHHQTLIPVEVKFTSTPTPSDARHLHTFIDEYSSNSGIVVCQTPHAFKLSDRVTAIPWQSLDVAKLLTTPPQKSTP